MTKEHYISFIAYVTGGRCEIQKLYPEQTAEARFKKCGRGKILVFCNKDGLFKKEV
jgi:desulfoferrodoxin (superoxide reductase-like protein)